MNDIAFAAPGAHAPFADDAAVEDIVRGFLDRSLARPRWNHHAHLVVSIWHMRRYGSERSLVMLRDRIWAYNQAVGTPNTDTSGYHETITRFFVWQVARYLDAAPSDANFAALVNDLAARAEGRKERPFDFWSRDVLMSVEARRGWIAPDLGPLET